FACRESHFSAYLILWFPLLIWWTPLCLIRQILTRRFRLYAYLKTQAAEVWLARIHEVGVPVAPLLSVAEAINLPQTQARNMLIEAGGIMMPGNPIKISGCADPHVMPGAATLDQHGEQIRQEFSS
ncbi:CoA transferase, partial [Escherichia coli]|uniref:CoA transferase n=2 Tax=Escherichia coli TaxID=562 RepID=UPI002020EDAD